MLRVFLVVATGCLALATAAVVRVPSVNTVWKDCGSKGGKIVNVTVSPCPQEPCPFKRGTNVTVTIVYTSEEDVSSSKTKVDGIIAGVPVPFPLPDENACHDMPCPVKKGRLVTYHDFVYVKPVYPKVKLVVEWKILDQNDQNIFCFLVPVIITD